MLGLDVWLSQDSEGDVTMGDAEDKNKIRQQGFSGRRDQSQHRTAA